MVRGYFRILIFACGLLVGIQIPGVMDQYQKRVDAHFQEVRENLSGFRETADRYFNGSLESLILYYKESGDPVFRVDAGSVEKIYNRYKMLRAEQEAVTGPWYRAGFHIVFAHNDELMAETFSQYSYTVALTPGALAWGLGSAFLSAFIVEVLLVSLFRGGRRLIRWQRAAPAS